MYNAAINSQQAHPENITVKMIYVNWLRITVNLLLMRSLLYLWEFLNLQYRPAALPWCLSMAALWKRSKGVGMGRPIHWYACSVHVECFIARVLNKLIQSPSVERPYCFVVFGFQNQAIWFGNILKQEMFFFFCFFQTNNMELEFS